MNPNESDIRPGETPLESWKEIGAYLQRNAVTARRWEKEEGLPVHRHSHKSRSSVYAYPSEIDAWRAGRKVAAEPVAAKPLWKIPAFALTMVLCLVMVGNGARPVAAQQSLAKRLLCEGVCADNEASISPDGRWMVLTDWDSGDLALRNMSTGKIQRLLFKAGSFKDGSKESQTYTESPVFSPDMRQVAFLRDGAADVPAQLRVMPNEVGGKSRVVAENSEIDYYEPEAWSPDGKSILVLMTKKDRTWQMAWVSVADGAVKQIVSLAWRIRGGRMRPSLSPDGRYIAYAALAVNPKSATGPLDSAAEVHIYLVASDGSGGGELVKTAGVNDNPTWTPDGKHLLFTSDRSGNPGLWSVGVESGKSVGAPVLVSADMNMVAMGMHSGSLYYIQNGRRIESVSIVETDSNGAKIQGATRISESFVGIRPVWSPDGKSVAFKRHHPGSADIYDLVVHSLDTGDERLYATSLGIFGPAPAAWFHDGSALLTGVTLPHSEGNPVLLYRIDLKSGSLQGIPNTDSIGSRALSPDDKTVYFVRRGSRDSANDRIFAVDVASGQMTLVFTSSNPDPLAFALSPDGRTLAVHRQKEGRVHIARVNVDGSDYREVYSGEAAGYPVVWAADGRSLLSVKWTDDKSRIVRIPAEGGTPEFTGLEVTGRIQNLDLSPNGSRLAFSVLSDARELWALDKVLSALK